MYDTKITTSGLEYNVSYSKFMELNAVTASSNFVG